MQELVPAVAGTEPETDCFEGLRASPTQARVGHWGPKEVNLCPGAFLLLVGWTDV